MQVPVPAWHLESYDGGFVILVTVSLWLIAASNEAIPVNELPPHAPLEEATASVTRQNPVMLPRRRVPTYDTSQARAASPP